uniref:Uncharacterized protein n=1 Tax=Fundulus heteroclitus TaxID=8078 RepID=A0A3Q2U3P6_FUNHE
MTKAFLPQMKERNQGHIVTIASALGLNFTLSCRITKTTIAQLKEIQSLIPPLEPLYTVQQSMKAILGEQEMICIPRIMYIPFIARTLLPWEANVVMYRFMGGDKCMLPFIKNAETKTSNVKGLLGIL